MLNRLLLTGLVVVSIAHATEAVAQSNTSSYYLTNRNREIRRASSASYFVNQNSTNSIFNRAAPRFDYSPVNNRVFSGAREKPFSGSGNNSGLSPYLGLGGLQVGSVPNYYSVVRPQLQQQRQNEQVRRQQMAQQQELGALTAQPPFDTEGSATMMPTGHSAVFMNLGGYFPPPVGGR